MLFSRKKSEMPTPDTALKGRGEPIPTAKTHFLNKRALKGPYPEGLETAVFGLGCFWGAERKFWELGEGIWVTAVGYAGGHHAQPDLRGGVLGPHRPQRGGAGRVRPKEGQLRGAAQDLLGEPRPHARHAPGQRRRHASTAPASMSPPRPSASVAEASKAAYQKVLSANRYGPITTEIVDAPPFYFAEDYHQQYLAKVPHGYCGLGGTGLSCPVGVGVKAEA